MGEIGDRSMVLDHVFHQYDRNGKGELTALEVQHLHADIRMGGISYPQVLASIKYVCATDVCMPDELYSLLQEMDRRYFLIQDFRWEFSLLDREHTDTITEDQARWMTQAVHGKNFSRRKWADFLKKRAVPGSRISFPEIEVLLCNVKTSLDNILDREEEEREKLEQIRKQREAEEAAQLEHERRQKLKEDEKRKKEEEKRRLEEEARRRMMEEEEERRRQQQLKEEEERMREEERLRELERQNKLEEERRQREDAERYHDAEEQLKNASDAERQEREFEEQLKRLREMRKEEKDEKRRRELEEEEERLKRLHRDMKHRRIRYRLKVAIKQKDRFKLEYTINEFETEKVEDKDMDLDKAKKLLKELVSKDSLRKAMSRREIEELEKAIEIIKKNGLEVQLARELLEANTILTRLRKIQRIRNEILELKQSTVAEIRSYTNPPAVVHTVMTATFLLLGHKEKETKDWKTVQALVGKTGKEGLKRRCLECDASKISLAVAKRAKELLERHDLDEVRDVSAGAATFHVFSHAMVEECFDIAENGPRASSGNEQGSKPRLDPSKMVIGRSREVVTTTTTSTINRSRSKTPVRSGDKGKRK